jgi:hypothetical protein
MAPSRLERLERAQQPKRVRVRFSNRGVFMCVLANARAMGEKEEPKPTTREEVTAEGKTNV